MMAFPLLLLIAVAVFFIPGWIFTKNLLWDAQEKIVAGVVLSLVFLYEILFIAYVLKFGGWVYYLVTGAGVFLLAFYWDEFVCFFKKPAAWETFLWLGMVVLWVGCFSLTIRSYSGGGWQGDWLEHYHRSLFYKDNWSLSTRFLGIYPVMVRPPLMNLICAYFMGQTSDGFSNYQVAAVFLNALSCLPVYLLAKAFSRNRGFRLLALAPFFLFNPSIVQNITYVWTRGLCNFFALSALYFYWTWWRYRDRSRAYISFVAVAAAVVTHPSAYPYAIFLAGHYFLDSFKTRFQSLRVLPAAFLIVVSIVGPWMAWCFLNWGAGETVRSVLGLSLTSSSFLGNTVRWMGNAVTTLIPHPLRDATYSFFESGNPLGRFRDYWFYLYQTNLLCSLGLAGLLFLWVRFRQKSRFEIKCRPEKFWPYFIGVTLVLAVIVTPLRENFGAAHVALQPFILIAAAFWAACFEGASARMRILVLIALTFDLASGIVVHIGLESVDPRFLLSNSFGGAMFTNPVIYINMQTKKMNDIQFLGDRLNDINPWPWVIAAVMALVVILSVANPDLARFWRRIKIHRGSFNEA